MTDRCNAVCVGSPFGGLTCTRELNHTGRHEREYAEDKAWTWAQETPAVERQRREDHARSLLAAGRARLDAANAETDAALEAWNIASTALATSLRFRWPLESELTYALGATCKGCGAPMAYQPDARPNAWDCADVLLGRVGTPEDKALVCERGLVEQPDAPPGKVLHDRLPFMCWSVKSDPNRKTRDLPATPKGGANV